MIGKLSKNREFIFLDKKPTENIANGLRVLFQRPPLVELKAYDLPIMTCDIKKGIKRYYLPNKFDYTILEINTVT